MKLAVGNGQHIGDRQEQQDAFGFSDPGNEAFLAHGGLLGVIADGMGGLSHGCDASHTAVKVFLHEYELKAPDESVPDALSRALHAANRAVVDLAEHFGARNGTGTTLAAAVLHGDALHWISAGDSRVYLCHRNSLIRVTSDHVYARHLNEEAAKGKISRAEAEANAERAALTSFLGDLKEIDRSRQPFPVSPGDRVIVCSDGLYRAIADGEMTAAFHGDPQTACDTLVQQALAKQRQHQDNLTIIAFSNEAGLAPPPGILNRTLAILAGVLLLGALAGGSYTRSWWGKHNTTAPSNSGAGTTAAAAPTPAARPNLQSQSEKSRLQPENARKHTASRSARPNAKTDSPRAGVGEPGSKPQTAKQQANPNPPTALDPEPQVPPTPPGNPSAVDNRMPAGSQSAPATATVETPPLARPAPSPEEASPVAAQDGENAPATSPADAGKSSGAAPSTQPQVPPPAPIAAKTAGKPPTRRALGL